MSDIRELAQYQEAEELYKSLWQPGTGQISDACEINVSPDPRRAAFTGTLMHTLDGVPSTHIGEVDLDSGAIRALTFGPGSDRLPKYSPDGTRIAFLSDRHNRADFQLYLLDPAIAAARAAPHVEGWVEYLHWSPDGNRILLGVAGHGADTAGAQGAVRTKQPAHRSPSWMPRVESGDEAHRWRRVWVYELDTNRVYPVGRPGINIWEAVWCGNDALAAVASCGPGEGLWYSSRLHIVWIDSGDSQELYAPQEQIGWPAVSPSGTHLAIVEAVCSDRWIVAGELHVIETASGKLHRVDTRGVDITYTEWRSDRHLLLAGHREFATVVGVYDAASGMFEDKWSSRELSTGGFYCSISGLNDKGDCALLGESFLRAPEIAVIRQGEYRTVKSFDLGYANHAAVIDEVECVSWKAPDGIAIQGWLLRPAAPSPHPLVMVVHGGPVWLWRPLWLGRRHAHLLMLLRRGFAVLFPNPRGSSGRGQDFIRHVLGDMGGADTFDCLSALDYLTEKGIADPDRLGVTGISYGGFMTAWLVTQDSRFAAAVAVAPVTNQLTEHLTSNIPHFVATFLADTYTNATGKYRTRSPVMYANQVKTPTLNICGELDRCTPPTEALQFHNALLENGTKSVLVTYPEEGHGVRHFPCADWTMRLESSDGSKSICRRGLA